MSYISHVDYKKMMDGFKKGAPKKMLQEDLEQEGNAFTAGLAKAKKGQEFKVGNKAVKDTSNYDSSMEEEMHSFDGIKKDTPHAHKLKVNAPNFTGTIFKNEDGTYVFYDVDNHNADPSLPPFKTITDLMKHFGIKMQDLHEDEMEESHPANDQWHEEFQTAISAMGLAGEAEARVMKALDHTDPMAQYGSMPAPEAAREFVSDLGIAADDYDDYEPDTDADYEEPRDDFDMAGGDFNDGEFWENEVKKLQEIAGVGPQDDGPEDDNDEEREKRAKKAEMDDEEAENAEKEIDEEETGGGVNWRMPAAAAKAVAQKHGAELKPAFDAYQAAKNDPDHKVGNAAWKSYENEAISWCGNDMLEAGMKRIEVSNILSGHGYWEDFTWEYMTALGKELGEGIEEGLNEGSDYGKIIPALKARGITYDMPEKEIIKAMAEVMQQEAGYSTKEIRYHLGYEEDFIPDLLQALKDSEMEEGLHMPPLQATGQTIMANEDQAPFGMSVLSPDERKQLKEFIESYKTIKKEIASLLEKAGKDPKIMENAKRMGDEAVPAERPAHYNEPTKTPKHNPSNLGGNRTGLVMTKAEMWEGEEGEHERIESMLDTKLHDAFHKVTGMIMKDLMADGFDGGDIKNFLQHEIDERAKEAINAQHDF